MLLPYAEAKLLIAEGDVLLFRGAGWTSRWIKWAGKGRYSHAAMASWNGKLLECVEFREWQGGRTVSLDTQISEYPNIIDVYRVSRNCEVFQLGTDNKVVRELYKYNGREATNHLRRMTGLPYGWGRIWKLAKHQIPLSRFFSEPEFNDKAEDETIYPVCSTAVAAAIRKTFVDLMPNLADKEMTPSHLANCRDLHYLFTIGA